MTGGAGFIGSNLVRWLLASQPDLNVINLDVLTYAGNLENLTNVTASHGDLGDGRYFFVRADIRDIETVAHVLSGSAREAIPSGGGRLIPPVDAVIHLAAESHVDRSIMGPMPFIETNVCGTLALLETCRIELDRSPKAFRFLHVSTDEVYGSLEPDDPPFTEDSPIAPNSPYAASKAGADLLVRAYVETHEFPALTTRCSNNYGPYQFPEKLIPLMVTRALRNEPLPVYGDGLNVRDWLHVEDHVAALWTVLTRGSVGEVYNIGGESEVPNITVLRAILSVLERPESLIRFVPDRPGHDRRYGMNIGRIRRELSWQPRHNLEDGLRSTVQWYVENEAWWRRVLSEAYRAASLMYLSPIPGSR